MTHGGAGRGQGRKSLARRVNGMRLWVPTANQSEIDEINALSPQERRRRLLGREVIPMRTFRYEQIAYDYGPEIYPTKDREWATNTYHVGSDLAEEVVTLEADNAPYSVYRITIYDERGENPDAEAAHAVRTHDGGYIGTDGRVGIGWGAEAQWMDSTGDIEKDIDMWLNDPDQFESRN